ncbi:unnamed protein product, partial [marine sediment metagenome]
ALNKLFEGLYHIRLAVEYQADCDISEPADLINIIDILKSISSHREVVSFLNEFRGILNLYQTENVDRNIFKSMDNIDIDSRINDLMLDSTFIEISKERRSLSLMGHRQAIAKIKNLVRHLSMKKSFKKLLSIITLPLLFVPDNKRKILSALGNLIVSKSDFSPVIVDIDRIAMIAIKRNRPRPFDLSTSESAVEPRSVYQLPGPPAHKCFDYNYHV